MMLVLRPLHIIMRIIPELGLSMVDVECKNFEIGPLRSAMVYMDTIGLATSMVIFANKVGLCLSMVLILDKVGLCLSMVFNLAKLGLPMSMVFNLDKVGLSMSVVINLDKLGLILSTEFILIEIGHLHFVVNFQATVGLALRMVVSGDYLIKIVLMTVTFHGMVWGEEDSELDKMQLASMGPGMILPEA
jgi:hypothetical protein